MGQALLQMWKTQRAFCGAHLNKKVKTNEHIDIIT